jgi:subtilase family serine protease
VGSARPTLHNGANAEATLDVQYAITIADGATVWYWTVTGWMLDFSQAFFNTKEVPFVVSMSWGWTEDHQCDITNCGNLRPSEYVHRINVEWCKIGLRGVSLFAASGDQGAPGDGNYDCDSSSDPLTPIYPGASPYIISVGATMLVDSSSSAGSPIAVQENKRASPPICSVYQCATVNTEGVCTYPDALITTGGGFSIYSPRPDWQNQAVTQYLKSGIGLPPSNFFNASNRGFPDISALGHNYLIRLGGSWEIVDGTSCSSPVWAAITTLLNDERFNAKKAPLGFLAPLLYRLYAANPKAFNSLPTGNNNCTENCCAAYGYQAGPNWDPVTGLGTPVYPLISAYIKNLP